MKTNMSITFLLTVLKCVVAVKATNPTFQLQWFAPFYSGGGYCSEAISYIQALLPIAQTSYQVSIAQHGDSFSSNFYNGMQEEIRDLLDSKYVGYSSIQYENVITVCHSEPGAWKPALYQTSDCPQVDDSYTIGRTMFETDRLPSGWPVRLNAMDEVWVPTEKVFIDNQVEPSKLFVLPETVDVDFFHPHQVQPLQLPVNNNDTIVYLSIFKWEERKGWKILLRAYFQAFTPSDNVLLVILTSAYHTSDDFQIFIAGFAKEWLNKELDQLPPIHIMPPDIPQVMLRQLYKAATAFVLPSHGEGWGRPNVEAMAMELPVISTFWNGPTEYMTQENSYPLQINGLIKVGEGPFKDHMWADPSIDHLVELLLSIQNDPQEAHRRGRNARETMIQKYSPTVVGNLLNQRIMKIILHITSTTSHTFQHDDL